MKFLATLIAIIAALGISPITAKVTDTNRADDIVTIQMANGHLYTFTGCEDYEPGDYVSAILWNAGTKSDLTDDMIISVHYAGFSDYAD